MSDKALDNAIARRSKALEQIDECEQKIANLKDEIGRIDRFISDWHAFAGEAAATQLTDGTPKMVSGFVIEDIPVLAPAVAQIKKRAVGNSKKEDVAKAARSYIAVKNEPALRSELYKRLTEVDGLTIKGSDPEMVLSTMLWRVGEQFGIVR